MNTESLGQTRPRFPMALLAAGLIGLALLALFATPPAAHAQSPGYTQVSAGFRNTCALWSDGNVECWGTNLWGESKDQAGSFLQVTADTEHSCAIKGGVPVEQPNVICWGHNDEGQASPPASHFLQISAGEDYTCGITAAGNADCWGTKYLSKNNFRFLSVSGELPVQSSQLSSLPCGVTHADLRCAHLWLCQLPTGRRSP